jgi:hypothetical protein
MNDLEKDNALRESERKYHQLVEDANSIIMRIDTEGKIALKLEDINISSLVDEVVTSYSLSNAIKYSLPRET